MRTAPKTVFLASLSILACGTTTPNPEGPEGPDAPDAPSSPDLSARIAQIAANYVDSTGAPDRAVGMVVVVVTPTESGVFGFGARSIGGEPPNRDTTFHVASVSKAFAGLALASAEQSGTITLSDPLAAHLDSSVPPPSAGGVEISLEHLVTHYGGLPALPTNVVDRDGDGAMDPGIPMCCPADAYTRADLDAEFQRYVDATETLDSVPGTAYQYSNHGSGLIGLALADALGLEDAGAALHTLVFAPLSMNATAVRTDELEASIADNAATGYGDDGTARLEPTPYTDVGVLSAGGGILSTGADMQRFLRAELGIDFGALNPAAVVRSQEVLRPTQAGREIAFALETTDGGAIHNKGGSNAGFKAFIRFRADSQTGVAVLANGAGADARAVAVEVLELLGGE